MARTTGAPPHKQDNGQDRTHKAMAARTHRDNDTDDSHNPATHQESRDRDEHKHFHAADTPDIKRSQASARAEKREKGREEGDDDRQPKQAQQRDYNHSDSSHYNDDSRRFQNFSGGGGNRSAGGRYEQMGHNASRRPDDGYGDPMNEVDQRYLNAERQWREERGREGGGREERDHNRDHYDGNRGERDRYDLNDRQNGWQANVRVDNRNDDRRYSDTSHLQNDWRDRQWRETATRDTSRDHVSDSWRPNTDWRNEQRNGSEYDRDRGSDGNSRFRDDDHGYRTSRHDNRDYGRNDHRNDPRQPRGYTATSERDYDDRNPSRERDRYSHRDD